MYQEWSAARFFHIETAARSRSGRGREGGARRGACQRRRACRGGGGDESSEERRKAAPPAEEEVEDTLLGRTKSIIAKTAERTTDLIDKTQEQLDRLDERTEALVSAAAKTLKKTSSDVKDRIVGPSAKRAADAVAETLADHYPVVRNAFLTAAAEPFDAIVDDDAGLAQQRLFDEYPFVDY